MYINDYNNTIGNALYGSISVPKAGISASIKQQLVNNIIYWDYDALPHQIDELFSITTATFRSDIKVWKLGFINQATFQLINNNVFGLPKWFTLHDLYFHSNLFDNHLLLRIGTNLRLIEPRQLDKFNPVTGQFYRTTFSSVLYPEWNGYLAAKISKFRVLIEYNNIPFLFINQVNMQVANQPYEDATLRIGINWLLLD